MKALKFLVAVFRLMVYVVIIAGVCYGAVLWRAEIVGQAGKIGVPEAVLAPVRDKLDQGAGIVIAVISHSPVKLPLPLPSTSMTPVPGKVTDTALSAPGAKPSDPAQVAAMPAKPAAPPVSVLAAPVELKSVPVVLDLLGSVQAVASIPVKVRIDSQIDTIAVHEGDRVKAGQTIFTLDSRAIMAQVEQAQALLVKDQALVDQTKSELDRTEPLAATKVLSPKDLDKARLDYGTAKASLAADKASLDNLKVLATYYEIKSPIDGRVGSLPLKPGSSIRAADALLLATINQTTPVYVSFSVPQVNVPALRNSMRTGELRVIVTLPGTNDAPLTGKVTFTENQIDAGSGTLTVKATVDNQDETLLPGEAVNVRVVLRTDDNAVTVPEAAVQIGQQGPYLFVLKADSTVDMKQVTIDRKVDGQVVIASGLQAGDQVIVDGQARLMANSRVELRHPAAKPDAAATQPKQQTGS